MGDGEFVTQILSQANGMDLQGISERVAGLCDMQVENLWKEGRYRRLVSARSLLCFWAVRELGISMTSLAHKLNISTMAVSKSVARGAELAKKEGYELI